MTEETTVTPQAEPKQPFLKALAHGTWHVVKVAWTVPAVQSLLVTRLIGIGLPSTLVAIGVAIGEKLAGN